MDPKQPTVTNPNPGAGPVVTNPNPGSGPAGSVEYWEQVMRDTRAETERHLPEFLGLTEAEAVALAGRLDLELRVIRHDREPLHMDYRPARVTVDLRTGTVSSAWVVGAAGVEEPPRGWPEPLRVLTTPAGYWQGGNL